MSQIISSLKHRICKNAFFKICSFREGFVAQHMHTEKKAAHVIIVQIRYRAMPVLISVSAQSLLLPSAQQTATHYPDF